MCRRPLHTTQRDTLFVACSVGGVMVEGFGGKIKLENTLTSRLHLAFETRLPQVREALFA